MILITLTLLLATALAVPTADYDHPLSLPPLFTVAAFQLPYPPNSTLRGSLGISGIPLTAVGGAFWINLNGPPATVPTVLFVDIHGEAFLDSAHHQQIYLNTQTGALSYVTTSLPISPSASIVNFLHLGQGTSISTPQSGGFATEGPGTFQWLGAENDSWFLCPRPGNGYQVLKDVGGLEDWNACVAGISLIALDYSGKSPATSEY